MSVPGAPVIVALNRRYRFSASHRLHVQQMTEQQNRELFGKCNNPYGHGHNYTLQVTIKGPVSPATGMVADLPALDAFVRTHVLDRFHFSNLNSDPGFTAATPSTENLATAIWSLLRPFAERHPGLQLERVRLEETNNNAFDYLGATARDATTSVRKSDGGASNR